MIHLTEMTVYADGIYYEPFVADDGRVGYRCVRNMEDGDSRETFIYFNPSSDGGKDANVFVYEGIENDPVHDESICFIKPEALFKEDR